MGTLVNEFAALIQDQLPGYLVVFNLADTKWRNLYVGVSRVDQDLQHFDELLKATVGPLAYPSRVGADIWLCFFREYPQNLVQQLFIQYTTTDNTKLTFTCEAKTPSGDTKVFRDEISSTVIRTFRCLVDYLNQGSNLRGRINQLLDNTYKARIGTLQSLTDVLLLDCPQEPGWRCISKDFGQHVCPICTGQTFNWIDGTDDTSYGLCTTCGSECDFRFY